MHRVNTGAVVIPRLPGASSRRGRRAGGHPAAHRRMLAARVTRAGGDAMPLEMHMLRPTVTRRAKEVPAFTDGGAVHMLPYRRTSHERPATDARRTLSSSVSIAQRRLSCRTSGSDHDDGRESTLHCGLTSFICQDGQLRPSSVFAAEVERTDVLSTWIQKF